MSESLTTITAIIGAASGLGSTFWHVVNWRRDRLDVRVEVSVSDLGPPPAKRLRYPLITEDERFALHIEVVNHGRRDVQIQTIGFELLGGTSYDLPIVNGLPCMLKDGHRRQFTAPIRSFRDDVVGVYAIDGRGDPWRLHQVDFLRVQMDARKALKVLEDESGMPEIAAENSLGERRKGED